MGFLNPRESVNGFCVFLLDRSILVCSAAVFLASQKTAPEETRSIQDLSDHGASKELKKSTLKVDSSVPLKHHDLKDLGLFC